MRVAFDGEIFASQCWGGVSRYFCQLAEALDARPDVEARIFAPLHVNGHLGELRSGLAHGCAVPPPPRGLRWLAMASGWAAAPLIRRYAPHVVHETWYGSPTKLPRSSVRVTTIHDMIPERFPGRSRGVPRWGGRARADLSARKRAAVERARHVICVSQFTREDLVERFDVAPERTTVIPLGFSPLVPGAATLPDRPYLLHVGARGGYKNFDGLLAAFAASSRLRADHELVCFGGGPFGAHERRAIAELGLAERVRHEAGDDARLAAFYAGATLFAYPSQCEGFGIPPLEAMSLGCPVVAARAGAIPEVVGDAAELVDPDRIEALRDALERVAFSAMLRARLVEAGHARWPCFRWSDCADRTMDVYRRLR